MVEKPSEEQENMEKSYDTEKISAEIKELVKCVDDFLYKRNYLLENLKQVYLETSKNN